MAVIEKAHNLIGHCDGGQVRRHRSQGAFSVSNRRSAGLSRDDVPPVHVSVSSLGDSARDNAGRVPESALVGVFIPDPSRRYETVRKHIKVIRDKMGVSSQTEQARMVAEAR